MILSITFMSRAFLSIILLILPIRTLQLPNDSMLQCGKNEVIFLGKCWCAPGWTSPDKRPADPKAQRKSESVSLKAPLSCSEPILHIGGCDCKPDELQDRSFVNDFRVQISKGGDYRCEALCRSNSLVGVPYSNPSEWSDNLGMFQLPFYQRELPQKKKNHLKSRLDEFAEGFHNFSYLAGLDLGDVVEFGAGGYTQLRHIMERVGVHVKSVVLVDPLIFKYQQVRQCAYATGRFVVNGTSYNTRMSNSTAESFRPQDAIVVDARGNRLSDALVPPAPMKFDTLIVMNVLVYCLDAFKFLEKVHAMIKPGGLLLFHDRWFDNWVVTSKCKTVDFYHLPTQVSKHVLDHFLSHFTVDSGPFFSYNRTQGQVQRSRDWCGGKDNEQGYWAALRKKA